MDQVVGFEVLKSLVEFAADLFAIAFFWWGALLFWRYYRLLNSMRTCDRCGREILNPAALACGRCGHQLRPAA
jgi:hypothetical protein